MPDKDSSAAREEQLLERRLRVARHLADHRVVVGHVAPPEDGQLLARRDLFDTGHRRRALVGILGQERAAHRVTAHLGQLEVHDHARERVGHLHEDAGAVADVGLRACRAAVVEVAQRGDAELDDAVAGATVHVHDEADAAGVVLECRVVQPLGAGNVGHRRLFRSRRIGVVQALGTTLARARVMLPAGIGTDET